MQTGFLDRSIEHDGTRYPYQVYVPSNYDATRAWPVVLFLHGAGERGSDGLLQTELGIGTAIRRYPQRYPAIVVMPQAPIDSFWGGPPGDAAMAALDLTCKAFNTDARRIYLTGLSMGGHGSWMLAYRHTDRFAAAIVICGFVGDRPNRASTVPRRRRHAAATDGRAREEAADLDRARRSRSGGAGERVAIDERRVARGRCERALHRDSRHRPRFVDADLCVGIDHRLVVRPAAKMSDGNARVTRLSVELPTREFRHGSNDCSRVVLRAGVRLGLGCTY